MTNVYKVQPLKSPLKSFTDLDIAIELFYPKNSEKKKAIKMSKANPIFKKHLIEQAKMKVDNAINFVYRNFPNKRQIVKKGIKKHPPSARHIVTYSRDIKRYMSPPNLKKRKIYISPSVKRKVSR